MKEQKLHRVTATDRRVIALSTSQNRRYRKWEEARRDAEFGPHCCTHCRKEPCGSLWPDAACCHRCSHLPMPHWRLTHVLWYDRKPFYVMEVAARRPGEPTEEESRALEEAEEHEPSEEERQGLVRGKSLGSSRRDAVTDAVYYRWDGVCQWVRRARAHYFLGERISGARFVRCLPNEEELQLFAPRERPPNPLDGEGIGEVDPGEIGDPYREEVETPPEEPEEEPQGVYYKRGPQFVEVGDEDARESEGDE